MKRIQVLRNLGLGLPRFTEGQTVEVDDQIGEQLIGMGLAVELLGVPPVGELLTGVPPTVDLQPADPVPVVDNYEETRRQPGHAKRSKRVNKE